MSEGVVDPYQRAYAAVSAEVLDNLANPSAKDLKAVWEAYNEQ